MINAYVVIGGLLSMAGFALIVYSLGWMAGLGVFLALWGYGVQQWGQRWR